MAWLWLLFPAVLLVAAAFVWRATVRLDRRRHDLEAGADAVRAMSPERVRR